MVPDGHGTGRYCTHRRYRMTCAEYDELRERAGGCCELCRIPESRTLGGRLFLDHDAPVGSHAVRGLLCNRCNSGLHLPGRSEAALSRYLASPWYLNSPLREERMRTEARTAAVRADCLAALDAATARYRETAAALRDARSRLRAVRQALQAAE